MREIKSIKHLYEALSIKTKWIIFVIFLVLYPMILVGYVGYKNYEQVITKHFIATVQNDVSTVAEYFQEKIGDLEQFVTEVQYDDTLFKINMEYYKRISQLGLTPDTVNATAQNKEQFNIVLLNDYDLNQAIEKFLMSLLLSRADVNMAAYQFAEQTQSGYILSGDKGQSYYDTQSFLQNEIFSNIETALEKEGDKTAYYVDPEGHIYIGQKIYYREDFRYCGKIIFRLETEYLFKHYESMLEGATQGVYLIDNNGKELVEAGELTQERKDKLMQFVKDKPQLGTIYKEEVKGESIVYNMFATRNLSIGSAVYVSTDVLLEDIRAMSRLISMLCLSILPIFLLMANRLYKEVVHPIYILSEKMHQIEKGEIGIEITNERNDEIGYVFGAFNKMSRRIHYLVNCVYKEQLALKSSELKMLQTQINPHFLYNTLEMINWKSRMCGANEVSEMIEALSGIMEVNIDRREEPFLTIKEEMDYLRNYVFLLQKRFGDRIQFKLDAQDGLMDYKIPRLLLQPLVENALTHGIEPLGRGYVTVEMWEDQKGMCIVVRDDGVGIAPDRLKLINEQLKMPDKVCMEDQDSKRGHIGVINVQRRIKLVYGDTYGLSVESEEGKGTRITLRLPTSRAKEL
ncbi:MAG: sensor histidine kinase [Cellulosilyticaceae bacterium]